MKKLMLLGLLIPWLVIVGCTGGGNEPAAPTVDPVIGVWVFAGGGTTDQVLQIRADGSWVSGQLMPGYTGCVTVMGTWVATSGGYSIKSYQTDGSSSIPWTFNGALNGAKTELTVTGMAGTQPVDQTFTKQAVPAADTVVGVWTLSPLVSPVTAQMLAIYADGSFVVGQIQDAGSPNFASYTIAGTWAKSGSNYTITAYQSPSLMVMDGVLSGDGNTFTVGATYVFTRRAAPAADASAGLWILSSVTNPPPQGGPVAGMLSVNADGSWIVGQIQSESSPPYGSSAVVGTWTNNGGGSYTVSAYQADGPGTGLPNDVSGSISGSKFSLTVNWGGASPMLIEYTRQ